MIVVRSIGLFTLAILLSLLAAAGCAGIKIESGQSPETEAAISESQASEVRRTFARLFDSGNELTRALLLQQHIDSTVARLLYVGSQFANEWHTGNQGRGQMIPDSTMRRVIDNSVRRDKPVLQAWEDNIEYGWEYIRDSSRFDNRVIGLFNDMIDNYYAVYSLVMYPAGDVVAYREGMERADVEARNLSRELDLALDRYR